MCPIFCMRALRYLKTDTETILDLPCSWQATLSSSVNLCINKGLLTRVMFIVITVVKDTSLNAALIFASSGPMGEPSRSPDNSYFLSGPGQNCQESEVYCHFFLSPSLCLTFTDSPLWIFSLWLCVSLTETIPSLDMPLGILCITQ